MIPEKVYRVSTVTGGLASSPQRVLAKATEPKLSENRKRLTFTAETRQRSVPSFFRVVSECGLPQLVARRAWWVRERFDVTSEASPRLHYGIRRRLSTIGSNARFATDRSYGKGRRPGFLFLTVLFSVSQNFAPQRVVAGEAIEGSSSTPNAQKREWTVSARWENDAFAGTDRFYTDGVSLGVSHTGPSWMDPLANWLPWGEGRRTVSYDGTQAMFTPSDKDRNPPDPNDRPYAGILSFGLALHVEKTNSYHGLKFLTGVVGPASLAEETQNTVHSMIGSGKARGWDYQLHNEPIFNFAYEYRHRFNLAGDRRGWSAEALPIGGGWLGNVLIQGQAGGLLRAGYHMPDDFGPTLVRDMGQMPPPRRDPQSLSSNWGFSVYGGAFGNLVLRDITLDGNTFQDSPSVDKKYFVPMAGVGMSVGNRRFQASFSYIFWGKEFEGQQQNEKFGSLSLRYFF